MKKTQKKTQKIVSVKESVYTRYRFLSIYINFNFDFFVLYKMYFQNYFAQ